MSAARLFPALGWAAAAFLCATGSRSGVEPVDSNVFVHLSKKVVPSVVNITTLSTVRAPQWGGGGGDDPIRRFFEDFYRFYGGRPPLGQPEGPDGDEEGGPRGSGPKTQSLGTGFIIDAGGLILTNNHVVSGADEIKVKFTEADDEKPTDGEVVGRDPELDLALIKVKTKRAMAPLAFGDSDSLEVGEYVMAVGNPFGQGHSVTHGIISAKERRAPDFALANYLQTDAPINPGNSGGPLVNLKGEVIGINNAIDQRAQGIGFAIPVNLVKKVLPQLKTKGSVSRGYIGVLVNELVPEVAVKIGIPKGISGPVVTNVYDDGPAEKAGLKPYDVIVEVNGKPVRAPADLIDVVTAISVGDTVKVKIQRGKESLDFSVKIGKRPSSDAIAEERKQPKEKARKKDRMDVGLELEDLTAEIARELGVSEKVKGVVVAEVAYGGPADKVGIVRNDIILEVDRKPVADVDAFFSIVKSKKSYLLRIRSQDFQGREIFRVVNLDMGGK